MTKRRYIIAIILALCCGRFASAQDTIRLTAKDVAANYGLQPEFLEDTNSLARYLDSLPQDFSALSKTCQTIAKNAGMMIEDLDVDAHDGVVLFDNTHRLENYTTDRVILSRLIVRAERMSQTYDSLETQRLATERKKAQERAIAEAKRLQAQKEASLKQMRDNINKRHKVIIATCNDASITNKTKLKELKDIYYAYLSVYNKYDLTSIQGTDEMLATNEDLLNFQIHLQDSILGENSYLSQIERFKDEFKVDSEKYPAVFKSYTRLFKKVVIPVNFATIPEYHQYIERIRETQTVQRQYRQTLSELAKIDVLSDNITTLYGHKYKDISSAYHTMVTSLDLTPVFMTTSEGNSYLNRLDEFQQVQQQYISNFDRLERINAKGDMLEKSCLRKDYDVVSSYKTLKSMTSFVANFKTLDGADLYTKRLDNFEQIQLAYDSIVILRSTIRTKEDQILNSKTADKFLTSGYKNIKKHQTLVPSFQTLAQGEDFIRNLNAFIRNQDQFLNAISERDSLLRNAQDIKSREASYPNIVKAYNRMAKTYEYYGIENVQDLARYSRTQKEHLNTQGIFLDIIGGTDAVSYNQQLKRVGDIDKIKLILKIN